MRGSCITKPTHVRVTIFRGPQVMAGRRKLETRNDEETTAEDVAAARGEIEAVVAATAETTGISSIMSCNIVMDEIKTEPEDDPLAFKMSDNSNMEEEKHLLQEGKLLGLHVNGIKTECMDLSHDTSKVKVEECALPIPFLVVKNEAEGQWYTSDTTNELVSGRTVGPPCTCKRNCRSQLQGTEESIFNSFWNLKEYDIQNQYLFSCLRGVPKKRSYPKKTKKQSSSRRLSVTYHVKVNSVDIQICKTEFLAVHGLQNSRGRIYNIIKQIANGNSVAKPDGRGKHKKLSPQQIQSVHDHIASIPRYTSHCSRENNPGRTYFDCNLNISKLYREKYVPWCKYQQLIPVSEDRYRRIFCTDYNIAFKLRKSDTKV
ncbi:uncharacterized protein [Periplaneta americana]|uniref:uncharacterized protein isoform X6 n=1 Tax=Periplaneta americana TaxID=6978 RepID=UPI0037E73D34